jgi:hypothetical protein
MVDFADLVTLPTRAQIKAGIISVAQALTPGPPLPVTSWVLGDPSERWVEISARLVDMFLSSITTQAVRAMFFDLSTDPGDAGDLSLDQTPRPGWLSAMGAGWWGVLRGGATYATGDLLVTNSGSTPATFAPFALTARRVTAGTDGGYPTFRNSADPAIYVGAGGTLTLAPGASATIPFIAEQLGSYSNAAPGQIAVMVTQSFGTLTCTNASPVLGDDREERAAYIARCRQQSAAASPNGPQDAYRYASTTGADGLPLQLYDGSGATTVNRVYVSADSSTGHVLVYLANPTGAATAAEVSSANGNINGITIAHTDGVVYNPNPIGVVPDTATLGPTITDAVTGADGPSAATEVPIVVLGTARIKAVPGYASLSLIASAQASIGASLSAYFSTIPIGGVDQVAGAGVVYRSDLSDTVRDGNPDDIVEGVIASPVLYGVDIDRPTTATSAILLGRVAAYVGAPTIAGAADNGAGLIRLEVSTLPSALTTADKVQVYSAVTTGGLDLIGSPLGFGIWIVVVVDPTHIDLVGSTFPGGGVLTSALLSFMAITVT